jgi:hypothetical protein
MDRNNEKTFKEALIKIASLEITFDSTIENDMRNEGMYRFLRAGLRDAIRIAKTALKEKT